MEIIGKISRGSKMDQIYISKNRAGFSIGNYVIIKPLEEKKPVDKLYFYGVKSIKPIKLEIIQEIMEIIDNNIENYENLIITGSFFDEGFYFNDIDIFIVAKGEISTGRIKNEIEKRTGIKPHILILSNKELLQGLESDPLYQMILSRCIAKKRFVYKIEHKINYKLLDLHLLKSKILIDNFDVLSGGEKYGLIRNMVAIYLYLQNKRLNNELVDTAIKNNFDLKNVNELKQNIIEKKSFLKKYKLIYDKTFIKILKGIKNGAEQKKTD